MAWCGRRKASRSAFFEVVLAKQRQEKRERYVELWKRSGRPLDPFLGLDKVVARSADRAAEEVSAEDGTRPAPTRPDERRARSERL